jgi:hypothetical protein
MMVTFHLSLAPFARRDLHFQTEKKRTLNKIREFKGTIIMLESESMTI